jgi:hypothetical protein
MQGDHREARSRLEQALVIDETAYGPDHPIVARDLMYLVELFEEIGQRKLAKSYCERALGILEDSRGQDHPDTLKASETLRSLTGPERE